MQNNANNKADSSEQYEIPNKELTFLSNYGIWLAFLLIIIIASLLTRGTFLQIANIRNVLRQASFLGIVAIGQTFVLVSGGLDMSVGSIFALSSVVSGSFAVAGYHPLISLIFGLIVGCFCGLFNGIIIIKGGINSFITTLATMWLFRSIALVITGGGNVYNIPMSYGNIARSSFFGIPSPILIWILVFILGVLVSKSHYGWKLYATGDNIKAAFLSGISVKKISIMFYMFSGIFSAIAGAVWAARLLTGEPRAAELMNLESIAAVVIGGAGLSGGLGSLSGTLFGVLVLTILLNIMTLLNINIYVQQTTKGIFLLVALIISMKMK